MTKLYINQRRREREREREREKESVRFTMHANLWFYKICLRFSDIMGSSATKFLNAHYNFFIINSNTVVEHKIIHCAKVHRTTHIFVLLCLWTHSPDLGLMRATLRMVSFSPSKYARSLLHSKQRKEDDSNINSGLIPPIKVCQITPTQQRNREMRMTATLRKVALSPSNYTWSLLHS